MIPLLASALFLAQVAAPPSPAPPKPAPQSVSPSAPQNVSPAGPQNVSAPKPANVSAPKPTVQPSPDPASSHFAGEAGMLVVAIKPAAVADYEEVIRTLQEALSKDADPIRAAAARGWRVYKAAETDAKGNALYLHLMLPAVPGFDYRPSLLVDELVKELGPELLSRYQEAFEIGRAHV